jgi:mercuric ion transport protein
MSVGQYISSHVHNFTSHFHSNNFHPGEHLLTMLTGFATVAAFFGSCCALPLLLMFSGIGSMGLAMTVLPYRPYFIGATLLMLAGSFYMVYGRKTNQCTTAGSCSIKKVRRTKIMLWVATVVTFTFLVGPYIYELCFCSS